MNNYDYEVKERYINLLCDFGFKKIFGEPNKDILIAFINAVIPEAKVVDITYLDRERPKDNRQEHGVRFDLHCETEDGRRISIEVQKESQTTYVERSIYYSTFGIREQVEAGKDDYHFEPVYIINIIDFYLPCNDRNDKDVRSRFMLFEKDRHILLSDKLMISYLEMNKFDKKLNELDGSILENFYFCLKSITTLKECPAEFGNELLQKLFRISEYANLTPVEQNKYRESMLTERDHRNIYAERFEEGLVKGRAEGVAIGIEKGIEKGREEGREENKLEIARKMKEDGLSVEMISRYSGLTAEVIESL